MDIRCESNVKGLIKRYKVLLEKAKKRLSESEAEDFGVRNLIEIQILIYESMIVDLEIALI